jgi:hypothetical protein
LAIFEATKPLDPTKDGWELLMVKDEPTPNDCDELPLNVALPLTIT